MLRNFLPRKIRRLRLGLNPRTWVPEVSMLTTRPRKPLPGRFTPGDRTRGWEGSKGCTYCPRRSSKNESSVAPPSHCIRSKSFLVEKWVKSGSYRLSCWEHHFRKRQQLLLFRYIRLASKSAKKILKVS
jgi:hypothetical protein